MKKSTRNILILICILTAAASIGLYIYIYTIPNISGSLADTQVLTWGELKTQEEARALIVRSEHVVSANQEGILSYYIEDSEKTRKFVKVADIYPPRGSAVAYPCEETGFVSYYLDGYEEILSPDTVSEIVPEDYIDPETEIVPEDCRRDIAQTGQPLFKLIDSDVWEIVVFVPEEESGIYEWNKTVTAIVNEKELECTVTSLIDKGDWWLAVLSTKQYYEDFARIRMADVTVITEDSEGLIVPYSAIVTVDGQQGVYVKNLNDEYDFTRIRVLAEGTEGCLVSSDSFTEQDRNGEQKTISTVSIYDEILRKPKQDDADQ